MPDFDTAIGFATPRQVTVLTSVDHTKHLYFLLPATVQFIIVDGDRSTVGLTYRGAGGRPTGPGYLTFTVHPSVIGDDATEAIKELKARDPAAQFAIPIPEKSDLAFSTIGSEIHLLKDGEAALLSSSDSFSVKLTDIAVRALLLPGSRQSPSASFQYSFTLRGVVWTSDGKPTVQERTFRIGGVIAGFCATNPETSIDLSGARQGCELINFDPKLVLSIEQRLRERGFYSGRLDSRYGPELDVAIRKFQRSAGLVVDGVPTATLRDALLTPSAGG